MPYTDLNSIHDPATNTSPPAAWGDGVYTNFEWLNPVLATYTPTLSQGASSNIAKTVNRADYMRVGLIVFVWVHLSPTASGTSGSAWTVTLPVTAATSPGGHVIGSAWIANTSVSPPNRVCGVSLVSTTTVNFVVDSENNYYGVTPNDAIASGDGLLFHATYRAAS